MGINIILMVLGGLIGALVGARIMTSIFGKEGDLERLKEEINSLEIENDILREVVKAPQIKKRDEYISALRDQVKYLRCRKVYFLKNDQLEKPYSMEELESKYTEMEIDEYINKEARDEDM